VVQADCLTVDIGLNLSVANPRRVHELAVLAEDLGYESVFVPDHLFIPVRVDDKYPGTPDGSFPWPQDIPLYDPFVLLARIAEHTSRIKLGTGIYILPLRHPIVAARAITAVDVLSSGRVVLGIGVGWLRQEFRDLGIDPASRFRRTEEAVAALRLLWTEKEVEFHGDHFDFGPLYFEPKPISVPHPPILFGGDSEKALERAVRCGDGWISGGGHDAVEKVARIRALRADRGDEGPFDLTVLLFDPDEPQIEALATAGVDRLVVAPWTSNREAPAKIEEFATRAERVLG
jgi:probable F420-dependent oxidoreductase